MPVDKLIQTGPLLQVTVLMWALYKLLKTDIPELKLLLVSGIFNHSIVHDFELLQCINTLILVYP